MTATSYLGKPTSRIDGRAKVTGLAKYAAEYNVSGLAHGCVVSSAIAKGRIKRIHTADALSGDGVVGGQRPHYGLRQDAGTPELPQLRCRRVRDAARQCPRAVALRRRWIRIRIAPAI